MSAPPDLSPLPGGLVRVAPGGRDGPARKAAQLAALEPAGEGRWRLRPGGERALIAACAAVGARCSVEPPPDPPRPPWLHPFQHEGALRMRSEVGGFLLADPPGLGKTRQFLAALREGEWAILLAPGQVRRKWARECAELRPDLRARVLADGEALAWPAPGELLIAGYGHLPPPRRKMRALLRAYFAAAVGFCAAAMLGCWPGRRRMPRVPPAPLPPCPGPGTLGADEAQALKTPGSDRSGRFRAARALAEAAGGRAVGLTGTPVDDSPADAWGVLHALGRAEQLWGSFPAFARAHGGRQVPVDAGGRQASRWEYDAARARPSGMALAGAAVLRRRREDVARELPSLTVRERPCELDEGAELPPEHAWREVLEALERGEEPGEPGPGSLHRAKGLLARAKVEAAHAALDEAALDPSPLVAVTCHPAVARALAKRAGWAAIDGGVSPDERSRLVAAYEAGDLRGLALTAGAGGTGIDLTRGWRGLIVDLPWAVGTLDQVLGRLWRFGQTRPVLFEVLVSAHPIDARIAQVILSKRTLRDAAEGAAERASAAYAAVLGR